MDLPRPWDKPGPFAAFKDHYVAAYGGVSYDLAPGMLGVAPGFARDLPGKVVTVTHDGPVAKRPSFLVVEINQLMRHALDTGAEGAVVFSTFDLDDPDRSAVLDSLDLGDSVYLNAAISRLGAASVKRPFAS